MRLSLALGSFLTTRKLSDSLLRVTQKTSSSLSTPRCTKSTYARSKMTISPDLIPAQTSAARMLSAALAYTKPLMRLNSCAIVVRAIEDTGLTTLSGNWLVRLSGGTSFGAVIVGTVGAAPGTNLINNRTDGCGDELCLGRYPARIAGDPTRIHRSCDAAAHARLKAPSLS